MSKESAGKLSSRPVQPFSMRWWTGDRGLGGLAQWPNPAIGVWLGATLLRWTGFAGNVHDEDLVWLGRGALLVWSLDELFRGQSPVRRLMGAAVLVVQAILLVW